MEFQTKKQKKDHLRLVNNIVVQGPVRCIDWLKTPITFSQNKTSNWKATPTLMAW